MYILRFLTSVHTHFSLPQGKDTGPLLVEAAEEGRLLTIQYLLEQVLMFRTEPVLIEPSVLTEFVLTELMFLTELLFTEGRSYRTKFSY